MHYKPSPPGKFNMILMYYCGARMKGIRLIAISKNSVKSYDMDLTNINVKAWLLPVSNALYLALLGVVMSKGWVRSLPGSKALHLPLMPVK